MTKRDIQKIVRKWQKILKLEDWDITVVTQRGKKAAGFLGQNEITTERKVCRISLSIPHKESHGEDADIETTIVHELIHIFFDPFYPVNPKRDKEKVILVEHAVEAISLALVRLDRERKRRVHQ